MTLAELINYGVLRPESEKFYWMAGYADSPFVISSDKHPHECPECHEQFEHDDEDCRDTYCSTYPCPRCSDHWNEQ